MKRIIYILTIFAINSGLLAMWKLLGEMDKWVIPDQVELRYLDITPQGYVWNLGVLLSMCLIWIVMFHARQLSPLDFFERLQVFFCFMFAGFDVIETIFDLNQRTIHWEWPIFAFFTLVNVSTKFYWNYRPEQ